MEYFINADSGSNLTGSGTESSPWETLAHAFDQSSADDTIICQDSTATYDWVTDIFDHNITIQGEQDDASGAVFDGGGVNVVWCYSANLILEKITFTNVLASQAQHSIMDGTIQNLTITMNNCIFHDIEFSGNRLAIVHVGENYQTINFNNCLFYDFTGTGETGIVDTTSVNMSTIKTYMTNSTVYFDSFSGRCFEATETIRNCIFMGGSTTLDIGVGGSNASYSCFYNTSNTPTGTGVITSDPLFVDAANGDFRLRPSSPCIDSASLI